MRLTRPARSLSRTAFVVIGMSILAAVARLSAHVVRGLDSPTAATAFVSSPSSGTDALIPVRWGTADSGLRIVCFNVANTSPALPDQPDWPRVTRAGFELPGSPTGFALLEPLDGNWKIVEGVTASLRGTSVTLDFAVVATPNGKGLGMDPLGIPPGQLRTEGSRFCVSGPFPDELVPTVPTTIEQVLNGVVVSFRGLNGNRGERDLGIWENSARTIPLYPD